MNPHYLRVAARAAHRCEYCLAPEAIFNFPFEVEHIIPLSSGGVSDFDNFALACRSCNLRKGVHIQFRDPQSNLLVALYHPRTEMRQVHFRAHTESGVIEALTAIGRATVDCLDMNSSTQVRARRQWRRLGLFP